VDPSFIYSYGLASAGIPPDHSSNDAFPDTGILQTCQGTYTLSLKDHFAVVHHLHSKVVHFVLQTEIFIMQANKGDVSVPHVPNAEGGSINQLLHWSESIEDPHPDETGVQAMTSLQGDEPGMNDKRDRQDDPYRLFGFDNDSAHPLYRLLLIS
jgi:hypothetical protein